MSNDLRLKHKRFVDEYLKDTNATQAAIRAGYSKKTAQEQGSRLLKNAAVNNYIASKSIKLQKKTGITQEWVLKNLKKVYLRCMTAIPMRDKDGNDTGEWKFESAGALKALELLGKTLGMFIEKREHSGKVTLSAEESTDIKKYTKQYERDY